MPGPLIEGVRIIKDVLKIKSQLVCIINKKKRVDNKSTLFFVRYGKKDSLTYEQGVPSATGFALAVPVALL